MPEKYDEKTILEVRKVNYHYKANRDKKILDNISYCFEEENVYAILGPSGSGFSFPPNITFSFGVK